MPEGLEVTHVGTQVLEPLIMVVAVVLIVERNQYLLKLISAYSPEESTCPMLLSVIERDERVDTLPGLNDQEISAREKFNEVNCKVVCPSS